MRGVYHAYLGFAEPASVRHDADALRNLLFGLFLLVSLIAVASPNYAGLGNRIEPFVFGLPCSLFWNGAWVVLSFFALLAYYLTEPRV